MVDDERNRAMFGAGTTGRTTLGGLDPMPAELQPLVAKINQVGGCWRVDAWGWLQCSYWQRRARHPDSTRQRACWTDWPLPPACEQVIAAGKESAA